MSRQELRIVTKPQLPSNKSLEKDFTAEIFRRVERTSQSKNPNFIFFRPQSRPKEEFHENIAPMLTEDEYKQDAIIVSISNNTETSDAYLDETGFVFKLRVNMVLTEGRLDIARNEDTFVQLANTLINEYRFQKWGERKETPDAGPVLVSDEYIQDLEELRSHLKKFKEPVALLILNDFRSRYTNSLLSALEGCVVPIVQTEMQAKQFHAYKWEENWIVDLGSSKDLDLGETVLDKVSKNRRIGVILVKRRGSMMDLKEEQMRIKSKSIREAASWHIVVAMETTDDCSRDSPGAKDELELVSRENKNRVHFVKNFTDKQTDSNSSFIHLTVLKNIMDCVNEHQVSPSVWKKWWFRFLLYSSLILLPVLTLGKIPRLGFNKMCHLFRNCYYCVWSYIWQDE